MRDVHSRNVLRVPYDGSACYRDFLGWDVPWFSAQPSAEALLAGNWFGLQVCYLRDSDRVFETYWTSGRAAECLAPTYAILDMWSPAGWPQTNPTNGEQFRTEGRPTAQWSRLAKGRFDNLIEA